MKQHQHCQSGYFSRRASMGLLVAMLLVMAGWVDSAEAFQRQVTRSGTNGNSATRTSSVNRTDSGYQRDVVRQGPQGNSTTKSTQGQWNADTGTWSRQTTATNANGHSAMATTSVTRTDSGYSSSKTVSGSQGNSSTKTVEGSWDPETNTWTKTVSGGGN